MAQRLFHRLEFLQQALLGDLSLFFLHSLLFCRLGNYLRCGVFGELFEKIALHEELVHLVEGLNLRDLFHLETILFLFLTDASGCINQVLGRAEDALLLQF